MAVSVSQRFREIVYSGETLYTCSLSINNNSIPMNQISSIKISSPIIDTTNDSYYIGTFVSQQLEIVFRNISELDIQSGYNVSLSISLDVDGTAETVKIGEYIIDDLAEDYQKTNKITCLDYAIKLKPAVNYENAIYSYTLTSDVAIDSNKSYYKITSGTTWKDYVYTYVSSPVVSEIGSYYERTTSSITLKNLLIWLCNYYDITLGNYPSTNNEETTAAYDSTVSGKQYISWIAEMFGGNAKFDRNGHLNIYPLKQETSISINGNIGKTLEIGEKYKITSVAYNDALRDFKYGDSTGNTLYIRQNNIFVNDTENILALYNALEGFEVYSAKYEGKGDISLDAWDILAITANNVTYNILNNNDITYQMSIMTTVNCQIPSKQQEATTNTIVSDIEDRVRKVYTEVNNINHEINLISSNTYTKTEIQEIAKGEFSEVEVSYVANEVGKWNDDGLTIEKQNEDRTSILSETSTLFNEDGVKVRKVVDGQVSTDKPILFSGYVTDDTYGEVYKGHSVTATNNIIVEKYFVIGSKSRMEEYTDNGVTKTGVFPL